MTQTPDWLNRLIAGLVFLASLSLYLSTVAPTFSFWDCGEFVASSATLGVPHPPGSPLYIAFGRLFAVLPIGDDVGWRVNLLSVFSSAVAVMFGYLITQKLISLWQTKKDASKSDNFSSDRISNWTAYFGGIVGAGLLGFGRTAWSNAVEAEVYGLGMAMMLAALYLIFLALTTKDNSRRIPFLLCVAYIMTLGLGVHMTVFLLAPALILALGLRSTVDSRGWLLVLLFVGVELYLVFALSSREGEIPYFLPMVLLAIVYLFHTFSIEKISKIHWVTGMLLLGSLYPLYLQGLISVSGSDGSGELMTVLQDLTIGQLFAGGLMVWGGWQFYLLRSRDKGAPPAGRLSSIYYAVSTLALLLVTHLLRGYDAFQIVSVVVGIAFVFMFKRRLNWLALASALGVASAMLGFWEFALGALVMIVLVSVVELILDPTVSLWLKIPSAVVVAVGGGIGWYLGKWLIISDPISTTVSIGVVGLALVLLRMRAAIPEWRTAVAVLVLALIGFSVNAFIPIRSAQNPLIDENNPSDSLVAFVGYLERKQYGSMSMVERMFKRRSEWVNQFGEYRRMGFWGFFQEQYGYKGSWAALPMILGVFGLWELTRRRTREGTLLIMLLLLSTVGLVLYMNFADGTRMIGGRDYLEVRERDYFFTPGFMLFGLCVGLGVAGLIEMAREGLAKTPKIILPALLVIALLGISVPVYAVTQNYHVSDRSENYIAYDYGYNLLSCVAKDGILITGGDNDTFPLWAMQSAYGYRRDVAVLNLSLANTSWYLKQMRDNWNLPLYMSDEQINKLRPVRMPDGRIVRVQEQIVDYLLSTHKTHNRKVQFSMTVPSSSRKLRGKNIDSSLTLIGRVYDVREDRLGPLVDVEKTDSLHSQVFRFRSLGGADVYQDAHSRGITNGYVSGYFKLADTLVKRGDIDAAVRHLERAYEILPNNTMIPQYIIRLLSDNGYAIRLQSIFDSSWIENRALLRYWVQHARRNGRTLEAIDALRLAVQYYPEDRQMIFGLFALEADTKQYKSMRKRLRVWVEDHPEDTSAMTLLNKLESGFKVDTNSGG